VKKNNLTKEMNISLLDLSSEVGKLRSEYNRITNYREKDFSINEDFENEIGDIFFILLFIMHLSGIDPICALNKVLGKMGKRIKKAGHPGLDR
jgi:NTP pyrophosphatase (non-canonical NTP hydrolase)